MTRLVIINQHQQNTSTFLICFNTWITPKIIIIIQFSTSTASGCPHQFQLVNRPLLIAYSFRRGCGVPLTTSPFRRRRLLLTATQAVVQSNHPTVNLTPLRSVDSLLDFSLIIFFSFHIYLYSIFTFFIIYIYIYIIYKNKWLSYQFFFLI